MTPRPARWSWTTMWAAAIVVLLPALAWLQYSWLDQIALADRERRERTVRTAASQLAQEFDLELGKAFFALQVDAAMLDADSALAYAERFSSWASSAANTHLVRDVYVASAFALRASVDKSPFGSPSESAQPALPQLRRWNADTRAFEPVEWPADMQPLGARLGAQLAQRHPLFRRGDRPLPSPQPDEVGLMIAPIVRVDVDAPRDQDAGRPDVNLTGFTIVRLDLAAIASEMLPAFVKRHFFDEHGDSDFRVAVVERNAPTSVVYESETGAAAIAREQPDATAPLMSAHGRPFFMIARNGLPATGVTRFEQALPELAVPPPPHAEQDDDRARRSDRLMVNIIETRRDPPNVMFRTRMFGAVGDGYWQLVAKHRAGSLETAVSAARTRNFAISTSILLLLSGAIALIVVSARRADRLGRQQMAFVATVSHELRTPVAVIGAAAGNLADGVVADPTRVRRYGETIQSEARRLGETVERVLQLAGIASGRPVPQTALAPATIVDEALDACRAEIDGEQFEVEIDVPAHLPAIRGDRVALRSALQNVIGNAVKYGRDGRWLRVSARAISGPTVPKTVRGSTSGAVEIVVADHGPGIPDEDRTHVFEAFYRGRDAIARQIQGSGLGLHLVQRIVEAHGGRVDVQCAPAPGCRFIITLPAVDAVAASQQDERSDVVLPDGAPGRVAFQSGQPH